MPGLRFYRLKDRRMILTLTVECAFGAYLKEQCIRTIEIDEEARLYDLHEAIQDAVQFGRDHPFQFFLANSASLCEKTVANREGRMGRQGR